MSEYNIKLLIMWYYKTKLFYNCHRDTSEYYNSLNKLVGFPVMIINVFNTTFLFSNYDTSAPLFILFIAILSLISTLLGASQSYLGYDKLQTQHTKLMIEYSKLLYTIENLIVEQKNNNSFVLSQDKINFILNSFEKLREEYIMFPEKIWKSNKLKFNSKLEEIDINTSDSLNIILSTIKNKKIVLDDLSPKDNNSETVIYENITEKPNITNLEKPENELNINIET